VTHDDVQRWAEKMAVARPEWSEAEYVAGFRRFDRVTHGSGEVSFADRVNCLADVVKAGMHPDDAAMLYSPERAARTQLRGATA
jgi:hypothetical protein